MSHYETKPFFYEDTSIIITSDVHLGSLYCREDDFKSFLEIILSERKRDNLPHLKALVFLGDFFDVMRTSYRDLCVNRQFTEIYDLLRDINRSSVSIVFVLGNHEISTGGLYNRFFKSRRKEFLEKMRKNGFHYNFLNDFSLCQFALLKANEENALTLGLYDSIDELGFDERGEFIPTKRNYVLSESADFYDKCYLLAHGFQFEDWTTHHFVKAYWWSVFLKLPEDVKKGISKFWFRWKHNEEKFDYESFFSYLESKGIKTVNPNGKKVREFVQSDGYKENKRYCKNIVELLSDRELDFVSHIVFGHTHEILQTQHDGLTMTNTGCWLKDQQTCFLQVLRDGNYFPTVLDKYNVTIV